MLNIIKEKKYKILIAFAIIFSFVILINTKVQAAGISISGYSNTILVGQTKEYFVSNATQASNWSVYTEKNNNVISAYKRTDRGYTRIECKALKVGTERLCVRDGVTGAVGYINITVKAPSSDLAIHIKGGVYEKSARTLYLFQGFESRWTIRSKHGWYISSPNKGIIEFPNRTFNAVGTKEISFNTKNTGITQIQVNERYTNRKEIIFIRVLKPVTGISIQNIPTRKKSRSK